MADISDIDISLNGVISDSFKEHKQNSVNRLSNTDNFPVFHDERKLSGNKYQIADNVIKILSEVHEITPYSDELEEKYLSGMFCECCGVKSSFLPFKSFNLCDSCKEELENGVW